MSIAISPTPVSATQQREPEPTLFVHENGSVTQYFIRNNPWKISSDNVPQKVFYYCVVCGDERVSEAEWMGPLYKVNALICRREACNQASFHFYDFVPSRLLEWKQAVDDVTTPAQFCNPLPKISLQQVNVGFLKGLPIEQRIGLIDGMIRQHIEVLKKEGKPGPYFYDDYLFALAVERKECTKTLYEIWRTSRL